MIIFNHSRCRFIRWFLIPFRANKPLSSSGDQRPLPSSSSPKSFIIIQYNNNNIRSKNTTKANQKKKNMDERTVRQIFRSSDAVCFDVDSTVCRDEAIDELAKFANKEKEVMEMTRRAMRGGCSFHDALSKRLQLIQPTVEMISEYLRLHPPRFTAGIKELVALLHSQDVQVYLVSGGFYSIIEPVAKELGVPYKNIYANRIKFFYDGTYAGFDETEPTCEQNGKGRVVAYLKNRYQYRYVTIIGDGVTDLEASPPADAFIGFGGNQIREKVKKEAKWFVTSFYDLIEELKVNDDDEEEEEEDVEDDVDVA